MKKIIITLSVLGILMCLQSPKEESVTHVINGDAEMVVPAGFTSYYDEGSDGYCIDTIAYENPTWSYEKCEDFLFLSEEEFKEKY
jgi:hypothetical protein